MVFNHKIKVVVKTLRSLFWSVMFNVRYLPLRQAYKLPILVYKPCFLALKGKVIIDAPIKTGMIRLGWDSCSLYYPNNRYGIIFENHGGTIIFKGSAIVGSGSAISVGPKGIIEFGNDFVATANAKFISFNHIVFGKYCRVAWEVIVMDTDLHQTINKETGKKSTINAEIIIGRNNWIGNKCLILKRTVTPDYCIIAAYSIVDKKIEYEPYCLCGGNPIELKRVGVYRDLDSHEDLC